MSQTWKSTLSFILATSGAAVGLGNIWRFPYMAGENGGGAFFIVFIGCLILIGIPVLKAEVVLGRLARLNPVDGLAYLAKAQHKSPYWNIFGWLGILILCMLLGFYSVIAGWSIAYIYYALSGLFFKATQDSILAQWNLMLVNPSTLILYHATFLTLTMGVVGQGLEKGIERATTWMMPLLFIMLIGLALYAGIVGNFLEAFYFLLAPDFSKITKTVLLAAMGQAFFSLAVGAGAMMVYGSYLPKTGSLGNSLEITNVMNVLAAVLAGLAIFPLVFHYGLTPEQGPGLMYKVLPMAFAQMQHGTYIGAAFFTLLLFAAWTSSISMAEPIVMLLVEKLNIGRARASSVVGIGAFILGLGTVYSFNVLADVRILGFSFFQCLVDLPMNILLPIGGLGLALFTTWVVGFERFAEGYGKKKSARFWFFLISTTAPVGILAILLGNFW